MLKVSLLSLMLGLMVANSASAQTVQFEFTAQREFGFGDEIGESLSGILTIDYGAQPDIIFPAPQFCGEEATWNTGQFTVDIITDSGYSSGTTNDGGSLTATSIDHPCRTATSSNSLHAIENVSMENGGIRVTRFETVDRREPGDGVADWFDFDPTGDFSAQDEFSIVFVTSQNFQTGEFSSWFFRVDSLRPIVTNIVIDGADTGIADFEHDGSLVSEQIQQFAETAKNHGKFVSSIAKFTNNLRKAGLISKAERNLLVSIAAASSIGKK